MSGKARTVYTARLHNVTLQKLPSPAALAPAPIHDGTRAMFGDGTQRGSFVRFRRTPLRELAPPLGVVVGT